MEEKTKRKIDVTIAGITLSLVTDESESFVNSVVRLMNETMTSLLNRSVKRSQLDAAMLCAIDFCGDKISAEKKVRNLEAQVSLYDVNLRRLKEENAALRKKLEGEPAAAEPADGSDESDADGSDGQIRIEGGSSRRRKKDKTAKNEELPQKQ